MVVPPGGFVVPVRLLRVLLALEGGTLRESSPRHGYSVQGHLCDPFAMSGWLRSLLPSGILQGVDRVFRRVFSCLGGPGDVFRISVD